MKRFFYVSMFLFVLIFTACQRRDVVSYENGTYRGMFADRGDIQVAVEYVLKDNKVEKISFRQLFHNGNNYRTEKDNDLVIKLRKQHEELINYLAGKDIRTSLRDLYTPEDIIKTEIDGLSGATVRSGKIISAINDGLNRGIYKY